MQKNIFIVFCERIRKTSTYLLRFSPNDQLIERIKSLPEETRKWNPSAIGWEVKTYSLYLLIMMYRGSTKIHFDFGNDGGRKIFITNVDKLKLAEKEKVSLVKELNEKKAFWVKYKQELEDTYQKYSGLAHKNLKDGVILYPHQIVGTMFLNEVKNVLLALDMGTGKAQPLDSKILTPNGWTLMGDIKIDDYVIGSNGKEKKVIGVFPQGKKKIYEVKFNDGTFTESCEEHLWVVNTPNRIHRTLRGVGNYPYLIKTLREILDEGLYDKVGNRKHYIPMVKPIEFKENEFFIHPYVLGCLLGDGGLTISSHIGFTNSDSEIVDELIRLLPNKHHLKKWKKSIIEYSVIGENCVNLFIGELKKYNISGCSLHTKSIPNDYKFSSIEQRLELLQGILDTDGYVDKRNGLVEITLASKQLTDDIQFIVESLGGVGRCHKKYVNYKGEKKLYWVLNIKLPPEFKPFKLSRKLNLFKEPTKYLPNRGISEINYIGEKDAQCILIDSEDHLYCTNHCILTHNTIISISYSELNEFNKVFVITPNSLKFNYLGEVEKFTNSKAHIINWKKNKYSIDEAKYIIVNYDYFNPSNSKKVIKKFNQLNLGKIDCLICDESHKLANNQSNTFRNFKKIFKSDIFRNGEVRKVFMSGTPAPSKVVQLYTVLNQISPLEFATKKYFCEYYCGMTYNIDEYGWSVDETLTKYEELFQKISPFIYRKKKSEVLRDLPEKIYQKIILEMSPKEYETYYKLEEGVANEFTEKAVTNSLAIMGKLRQYTSHLKTKNILELIDTILESDEKFVIVDFYKDSLIEIFNKYSKISVLHTGDYKDDVRAEMITRFQDETSEIKLFLGSESTTKEGLTLTAASKIGVSTIPWNPGTIDQITDRLARIGQKNVVNAYLFIYRDSIDEYTFDLVEAKRSELSQVIDGEKYETDVNQSIINDLVKIIRDKHGKKI